jgi:hypothetical protein
LFAKPPHTQSVAEQIRFADGWAPPSLRAYPIGTASKLDHREVLVAILERTFTRGGAHHCIAGDLIWTELERRLATLRIPMLAGSV